MGAREDAAPTHSQWWSDLETFLNKSGIHDLLHNMYSYDLVQAMQRNIPVYFKRNVNIVFYFTAAFGLFVGLIAYFMMMEVKRRRERVEEEEATRQSSKAESDATPLLNKDLDEEDDDATSYRLLRGRFNKDVINNLRKYNLENGELVQFDKEEEDESASKESMLPVHRTEKHEDTTSEEDEDDCSESKIQKPGRTVTEKSDEEATTQKLSSCGEAEMIRRLGALHGKLATAKLRQESKRLSKKMTVDEKEEEAKVRAEQLEAILSLMIKDKEKFGIESEDQLLEQMDSLYNI